MLTDNTRFVYYKEYPLKNPQPSPFIFCTFDLPPKRWAVNQNVWPALTHEFCFAGIASPSIRSIWLTQPRDERLAQCRLKFPSNTAEWKQPWSVRSCGNHNDRIRTKIRYGQICFGEMTNVSFDRRFYWVVRLCSGSSLHLPRTRSGALEVIHHSQLVSQQFLNIWQYIRRPT